MDTLTFPLSRHEADLVAQALDVYATTLLCAPLGLGLDLMGDVRALRAKIEASAELQEAAHDAVSAPDGNVVAFARG